MTTEEKARAYDEALERAKRLYNSTLTEGLNSVDLEDIFPELRESEDERIRKALVQEFKEKVQKSFEWKDGIPNNAVLAWLEKQKEQKPKNILTDNDSLQTAYLKGQTDVIEDPEAYGLQKEQKSAEWSDGDERIRMALCDIVRDMPYMETELRAHGLTVEKALSYLENQNHDGKKWLTPEQFNRIEQLRYEAGFDDGVRSVAEKQKEQNSLDISAASEWLRKYVDLYMNSEYNEFHKCVEYDGSIDKERLINDFENAMQKEPKPVEWEWPNLSNCIKNCKKCNGKCSYRKEPYEEQQPVECIEFDNEFENQVSHILASLLNGEWVYDKSFIKHVAQSLLEYAKNELKPTAFNSATINGEPIPTENQSVNIPLTEWSGEDEKIFWGLTAYIPNEELKRLGVTRFDILKKFKSIRPQSKVEWGEDEKIRKRIAEILDNLPGCYWYGQKEKDDSLSYLERQKGRRPAMIQWTGKNLKEVIEFTGKSDKFEKWFKSWDEYEAYVRASGNILKLFCEGDDHYKVPVGAWIIKTPDGHNVPSCFEFVHKPEEIDENKIIKKHITEDVLSSEVNKRLKECGWYVTSEKPEEWSDDIIQKAIKEVGLTQHQIYWLKANVFPPKKEWSNEDGKMLNTILKTLQDEYNDICNDKYGHEEIISDLKSSCRKKISWLEALPEKFDLKK